MKMVILLELWCKEKLLLGRVVVVGRRQCGGSSSSRAGSSLLVKGRGLANLRLKKDMRSGLVKADEAISD